MGNRRKSALARAAQSYRNAGRSIMLAISSQVRYRPDGEVRRGEGRQNHPYGVGRGNHATGVLALKKNRERPHRDYAGPDYASKTREELRALAKAHGHTGYGKMTKPELIDLLKGRAA